MGRVKGNAKQPCRARAVIEPYVSRPPFYTFEGERNGKKRSKGTDKGQKAKKERVENKNPCHRRFSCLAR